MATMTTTPSPKLPASASRSEIQRFDEIPGLGSLLPWRVHDLSLRPYRGSWSMNPSIHFDGETWRCILRCADYAMPGGTTIRSQTAAPGYVMSRNAMVILEPQSWRAAEMFAVAERDQEPRLASCTNVGFEDVRLFTTRAGGLQGIAASLHLDRRPPPDKPQLGAFRRGFDSPRRRSPGQLGDTAGQHAIRRGRVMISSLAQPAATQGRRRGFVGRPSEPHPPEQVLLTFDDEYSIIDARPLRGEWSGRPQKNWSPFDGADEPYFLYSIDKGTVFTPEGPLIPPEPSVAAVATKNTGGTEVRMMRNPISLSSGRAARAGYRGLRGGTQLHCVGDALDGLIGHELPGGGWVGLAHDMRLVYGKKFYWHVLYAVDGTGELVATSDAFKLDLDHGIEFAAGLAVDGDTAVISYGIDDMQCKLGVTSWDCLLGLLIPLDAELEAPSSVLDTDGGDVIEDLAATDDLFDPGVLEGGPAGGEG